MAESQQVCKNCGNEFSGKYCNLCGEKVYTDHDKSVLHFFEDAVHFLTHFEGTFFNTLGAIFTKPGKLSLDYCNGIRKRYFKPLSFFMLLVILYLLFPLFSGLNMPFKYYLNEKEYAREWTTKKTGVNLDSISTEINKAVISRNFNSDEDAFQYGLIYADSIMKKFPKYQKLETKFNKTSEKTSKILLLILIPLAAFVLFLLSIRKKRFFFDQLVLATELNSFFILFSFFIVPLLITLVYRFVPKKWYFIFSDDGVSLFSYSVLALFGFLAFRRFYNDKWWWALPKGFLVSGSLYLILMIIYKNVLFAVTFYLSK